MNKTYFHKKTGIALKLVSMNISLIGKAQQVAVEVCEILTTGHKFVCPVTDLKEELIVSIS